jgi:hypothetical protein
VPACGLVPEQADDAEGRLPLLHKGGMRAGGAAGAGAGPTGARDVWAQIRHVRRVRALAVSMLPSRAGPPCPGRKQQHALCC